MKFCPNCQRALVRDTSSGAIMFNCTVCGTVVKGAAQDCLIETKTLNAEETTEMYKQVIDSSAFDPTNQLVEKNCDKCGLDYMSLVRVGENETIIYTCECGNRVYGSQQNRSKPGK